MQYQEGLELQRVIKEESTAAKYLNSKEQVRLENVTKQIEKSKKEINAPQQSSFFDF